MGLTDEYGYQAYISDKTGSSVPASSLPSVPGCTPGQCCTGVSGAGVAPDGPAGQCRPVFSVSTVGTGLGTHVVNGVAALLSTVQLDVYVQVFNDPAELTDVVGNFVLRVEPDPAGGADAANGATCLAVSPSQLADNFLGPRALVAAPDGALDTIRQVSPGPRYCFNVIPKPNTNIPATGAPQMFRAWLRMLAIKPGGGAVALGADRQIQFIVPAAVN